MEAARHLIPNQIHFIFGLRPDFGGQPFSYMHYLAVATAIKVNNPESVHIHYCHRPDSVWWDKAARLVQLHQIEAPSSIFGKPLEHHAHRADILRLEILLEQGGIYLDMDVVCVKPFAPLLGHEMVMGKELGVGLCNAVILARRGADFLTRWYRSYDTFDGRAWGEHSLRLPARLAAEAPESIQIQDEFSFFFPLYYDPPRALWDVSAGRHLLQAGLEMARRAGARARNLVTTGELGRLYPDAGNWLRSRDWLFEKLRASYCIHLWESTFWKTRLQAFSPDDIRCGKGNLARLMRVVMRGDEALLYGE